ncbi:dipeptide/oligopeptide/nickel ABC transporter permease/ATP-binding protein [Pelagibacterium halotolerans]|uniref:Oligopeptide transport ATP-binding protein OppD n=1 Tax=Pelagibacterium halotolerans (strain DSM 22347 / JCM 15775 / CGMCC 1.7692 / B2) TaxID=1082931 RepID=G4R7D2_PELHB|nr:dipeptide/oligopeptide/nickel ABC transporter permease/ATP-binding protein [Pelagibacterium halotolerans]AEQ51268.1 oligopeptide transport ATP-binding protein OppD [Pelagibacterium halotolerans B2]QJR18875.1 dipeptide/oligopeptide/nickel ABC transporter permease/ATP-binding protein [Pelagibacterium halotolerans]SEA66847.1 peptide/nickel transport system permease protein [Pelagibacterium halotolerans]
MTDQLNDMATPDTGQMRQGFVRSVLANPLGLVASIMLAIVFAVVIFAPLIAPYGPDHIEIFKMNAKPGNGYLLGGDGAGRDVLSRLIYGSRNTLAGAAIAVGVAGLLGVCTGLIAGYYGGKRDVVLSWIADGLMALPALIVLLAFYQALGTSIYLSMVVFGIMLSPGFFRLTRNLVNGVKHELYIDAARVSGLSDLRIIVRHVLRVIRAPLVIQTSIVAGIAIVIQAGLEFLGLGNPGTPTWGGMLQNAFANMYTVPIAILWPGLAISLTVASFVLLANAIRDRLQQGDRVKSAPFVPERPDTPETAHVGKELPAEMLLEVRDLVVGYPSRSGWSRVVRGVSLSLKRGEVLGLVGESGSGKTQTAFAILGLLSEGGRILSGSIWFDGQDLTRLTEKQMRPLRGKRIAYVPQEPMSNLDPAFRIGYQLVEPMVTVLGISKAEARARALDLLARVGLPDPQRTFNSYPHQISGGMAQRVLIAGAISCKPDLLIADEPTTALDVTVQAEVLDLLRDLQAEFGMSLILVTHNFGVVADTCEKVSVMKNGEVVETQGVTELFAAPHHDYTRMLLDSVLDDSSTRTYVAPVSVEVKA